MQLVFNLILKEKDDFGLKGCQGKLKGVKAKTLIKPHLRVLSRETDIKLCQTF